MRRCVLTVDLRDDPAVIAAYREHHRRVWPEVVDSLRRDPACIAWTSTCSAAGSSWSSSCATASTSAACSPPTPRRTRASRNGSDLMRSLQEPPSGRAPGELLGRMEPVFQLCVDAAARRRIDAHQHFWRYDPARVRLDRRDDGARCGAISCPPTLEPRCARAGVRRVRRRAGAPDASRRRAGCWRWPTRIRSSQAWSAGSICSRRTCARSSQRSRAHRKLRRRPPHRAERAGRSVHAAAGVPAAAWPRCTS